MTTTRADFIEWLAVAAEHYVSGHYGSLFDEYRDHNFWRDYNEGVGAVDAVDAAVREWTTMTTRDVIATALSNLDDACGDWSPNAMENAVAALDALEAAGYRVVRQEDIGTQYCTLHASLREEDEQDCDFRRNDDEPGEDGEPRECVLVDLWRDLPAETP